MFQKFLIFGIPSTILALEFPRLLLVPAYIVYSDPLLCPIYLLL